MIVSCNSLAAYLNKEHARRELMNATGDSHNPKYKITGCPACAFIHIVQVEDTIEE